MIVFPAAGPGGRGKHRAGRIAVAAFLERQVIGHLGPHAHAVGTVAELYGISAEAVEDCMAFSRLQAA
jgi:hypothetical protein